MTDKLSQVKIIEIKTRISNPKEIEKKLLDLNAKYIGEDHQIDTYFEVPTGRLKLREGNIENTLIYYNRVEVVGKKQSNVDLYKPKEIEKLKTILTKIHDIKVIVDKKRKIFFIDHVKFHIDKVKHLGDFMEIEAIDTNDNFSVEELDAHCQKYMDLFNIKAENCIDDSYSGLRQAQPTK